MLGLLRWTGRTLLEGLGAVLPLAITLYLLGWLAVKAENLFGGAIQLVLPDPGDGSEPYYIPGMGIVVVLIFLMLVGMSLRNYLVRRAREWEDRALGSIPLVRTLYSSMKDIGQYFKPAVDGEKRMGQTCIVRLPNSSIQLLGFITKYDPDELEDAQLVDNPVMVYLPMSYQVGGYLIIVPREDVQPIDVAFDDALSYIFMAGMRDLHPDDGHSHATLSDLPGEKPDSNAKSGPDDQKSPERQSAESTP